MNSPLFIKSRISFLFLLAFTLAVQSFPMPLYAQDPITLVPGKKLERNLAAGETHKFLLKLDAKSFFFVIAEQKGVDIGLQLTSPGGRTLGQYDSPNGKWGPEYVSTSVDSAGSYVLEVSPLVEKTAGHYTIVLVRVEPTATDAASRADQIMIPWTGENTPGASIGVVTDGKLVFAKGYGMADLESGNPNSPQTIFHMASVSKQFTAMAILMLADHGKLSLDDSIQQYLPEMPSFGKTITLRHLLHNTSGLRDQWNLWALAGGRLDDVIEQDELYRLISRQRDLNFAPNSEHLYCNTGYMLLAKIVERVSGTPFKTWMQENVFSPLGMTRTQIYDDHQRIVPGRAYSFDGDSAGFHKMVLSYANCGATSLFSTVEDLTLWLGNYWNPRVGGQRVLQMMQERAVLAKGDTIPYASGVVVDRYRGLKRIQHGGADAGYRSQLICFPEIRGGVIVLSNLGSFNAGAVANQIVDAFFVDKLEKEKPQTAPAASGPTTVALPVSALPAYEGQFYLQEAPNVTLTFTTGGGHFYTQVVGQPQFELFASSDTTFFLKVVQASITFHRQADGKVKFLTLHQNGDHVAARVETGQSTQAEISLPEYAGRYYSPELETVYTLVVRNGKLFVTHRRHADFELTLVEKDRFASDSWFFGQANFERGATGAITGMRVSAGRVRNLLFVPMDKAAVALQPGIR